jgi:hypothetical protein
LDSNDIIICRGCYELIMDFIDCRFYLFRKSYSKKSSVELYSRIFANSLGL